METLEITQDDNIIKSMGIAFPEGKISAVVPGAFFKMKVPSIDTTQFSNLNMISKIYNQEVNIKRSADHLVILLTENKPQEVEIPTQTKN